MSYDAPVTSTGATTWTCSAVYGTTPTVSVSISITIGDSATQTDADSALQDLVNLLSSRSGYSNVSGVKSYKADTTQTMEPSV